MGKLNVFDVSVKISVEACDLNVTQAWQCCYSVMSCHVM